MDLPDWTPQQQADHRRALAAAGLIPAHTCLPCLRGEHVTDCQGPTCACGCRRMLDPFGGGGLDPTAPTADRVA